MRNCCPHVQAKTTRNNNSSRFGRYVLVRFSEQNEVVGAQVRTFLLERSRVTSTSKAKERSYHILYELVAGKTAHVPEVVDKYRYLSMSGCTEVPDHNDAEEFMNVHNALLTVGMSKDELDDIWAFTAAMLCVQRPSEQCLQLSASASRCSLWPLPRVCACAH